MNMKKALLLILFFGAMGISFAQTGKALQGVTVSGTKGEHSYVDLGLKSGLLWATSNVGALTPDGYGDYFAWGETKPQMASDTSYSWSTYKFMQKGYDSGRGCNKYTIASDLDANPVWFDSAGTFIGDSLLTLLPEDDAATVNWGSEWRMPTRAEQDELREGCIWVWTDNFNGTGIAGTIGTSKSNGNVIFLPAAGCRGYGDIKDVNSFGRYWPSTLSIGDSSYAYELGCHSGRVGRCLSYRYYGESVRAVTKK